MLVYGADTLAAASYKRLRRDDEVLRDAARRVEELFSEYCSRDPASYGDVLARAGEVLRVYIESYAREAGLDPGDVRFHVLPGVGSYRLEAPRCERQYRFTGHPGVAAVWLELTIYRALLELEPDAVVLDLTHGLNYFPAIVYKAARRALRVYSALRGRPVGLAAVNSDPVVTAGGQSTVHVVEAGAVEGSLAAEVDGLLGLLASTRGGKPYRMLERRAPGSALKSLEGLARKAEGLALDVLSPYREALRYGVVMPLIVGLRGLNACEAVDAGRNLVDAVESLVTGRNVRPGDHLVEVSYDYTLDPDYLAGLVYSLEALSRLAGILASIEVEETRDYIMAPLEEIRRLADYIGLRGVPRVMLTRELDDIDRRVRKYVEQCGDPGVIPYGIVYEAAERLRGGEADPAECESRAEHHQVRGCSVDERNFIAHAGLERNVTLVKVRGGTVWAGYRLECLGSIEGVLKTITGEGGGSLY